MTITPFVAKVAALLQALECHELVCLFDCYIALPSTRNVAGDIFEAYCHVIISKRIKFKFVPMVHTDDQMKTRAAREHQLHLSHTKFQESKESSVFEALCVEASVETVSLSIDPSHIVNYSMAKVTDGLQVEADVYYILLKINQVRINSFILHNNNLYLLQMTVSDVHGIKSKLEPFLLSLKGLPSQRYWHFIFVKPPCCHNLACPVPDCAELWNLALYLAEIEVLKS
jgi:hypothetical protein